MHISEMQQKIKKESSAFEIIAFEVVAQILHIAAGILDIGGQYVSKHSYDLWSQ